MFSILTFNMQNGQAWKDADPDCTDIDLACTVAFLREQDADIICLQEVEQGFDGGGQMEPPPNFETLKKSFPGYHSFFAYPPKNPLELPFGLGLAIFSRTPLEATYRLDLPPADVCFEFGGITRRPSARILLGAETVVDGHRLRLINTHLQAYFMINSSSNAHRAQRDLVADELRSASLPTVAAGDFNCTPEETVIQQFATLGFRTAQNSEVTWKRRPLVVDHVFYNDRLSLENCAVIPTAASDHHAVRAEFRFAQ